MLTPMQPVKPVVVSPMKFKNVVKFGQVVPDQLSTNKPLVIIESPFAGADREGNIQYARQAVRDSLLKGEAPIASHLLYTQEGILNDDVPEERKLGIDAGLAWRHAASKSVVYVDRGISKGMQYGIQAALAAGKPIEYRTLKGVANLDVSA